MLLREHLLLQTGARVISVHFPSVWKNKKIVSLGVIGMTIVRSIYVYQKILTLIGEL